MEISNITATDLQDEIIGPAIIKEYRKDVSKRMKKMTNIWIFLAGYTSSIFQDIESYLRTEVGLVEDDIRSVLD